MYKSDFTRNMIYNSYRNFSSQEFIKNVFTAFSLHIPVSKASIYEFKKNTFKKISSFTYNSKIFYSPSKIVLNRKTLHKLIIHFYSAETQFKSRIFYSDAEDISGTIFKMMHSHHGTSICIPIVFDINMNIYIYISLYSHIKKCYTDSHLKLCDAVCEPLGMAIKDILLYERNNNYKNEYIHDNSLHNYGNKSFIHFNQYVSEYIKSVLQYTNGRVSGKNGAAELLGIPATTLWSKMRSLKIQNVKVPCTKEE